MKKVCVSLWGLMTLACVAQAAMKDIPHPFIMWTRDEAAELKKRIETDPLAKQQYQKMASTDISQGNPTLWNLFNYIVMGDKGAGQAELGALLGWQNAMPEPMRVASQAGATNLVWNVGMPSAGDRHMRDEQTLMTLRYDALYDLLTPEQRAGVEQSMRNYIQFHVSGHKPWHPDFKYDRTSWLPNMHWPRAIGTHLMAAALKDEKLIEAMFNSQGGWKYYFDDYITDGKFYNEEFGKYYSNIGTMIMYCEALERLGLGNLGYGYTGKGGATMRNFLRQKVWIGLPRAGNEVGHWTFPCVTMGDASGTWLSLGAPGSAKGGGGWWSRQNMNGPTPKMLDPFWYELGHKRWPEDGFAYFLAHMRRPGEEIYLPSLYFGVGPIDPATVKPPPAPSFVARERGFAVLRAEESPTYWESPKPVVALQFGMRYVHYVHDCFTILNFNAFNRPIYERMGGAGRPGYAGGNPWADHALGKAGAVIVDGRQPQPVDDGNSGCANHRIRDHLAGPAKFVAARARGVYPDVDMERIMALTDTYLLDLHWLTSDRSRQYDWHIMSYGHVQSPATEAWVATSEALAAKIAAKDHLSGLSSIEAGAKPWSVTIRRDDQVNVRVSMLDEADTLLTQGLPPGMSTNSGVKILASRSKPTTVFVSLHEPFGVPADKMPALSFERVAQTDGAAAVKVGADRVLVAFADGAGKEQTLAGNGESFTFTDFGFVRVGKDKVEVTGNVRALTLKVNGSPTLFVNGTERPSKPADGMLVW